MDQFYLPRDQRDATIAVVVFRCANYFGTEVGKYFDSKMQSLRGKDWLQELGNLRKEYKINLYDPSFVLKEPLYSDSPLRQFLPKSESFYRKLGILKRIRNDAFHNKFYGDIEQTIASVEIFFDVAMDIGISECAQQFANLIVRLREIEQGKTFDQDAENQKVQAEKEKAFSEDKLVELNEKLQEVSKKSAMLEHEIHIKEESFRKQLQTMQANNEEIDTIKILLIENQEQVKILTEQNEAEKLRIQEIKHEKDELQEVTNLLAQIVMDDDKLQEFRSKVNADSDVGSTPSIGEHEIGSVWTKGKGRTKITLSVRERDLIDPKSNKPISRISESIRKELAAKWLKIRPSGGRVFVDDLGNASTLVNDHLIFLGNISELATR